MSDMYGLNPREALTQIFYGHGPQTGAVEYQTWTKPRGISMVMLVAIGGGGSGGGGFTRASGAAGGGGGGGGAGAMTRVLVPASFLPDVLYPAPAPALAGGTASNNGLNGTRTIIAIQQDTSSGLAPNLLIRANGGSFGSGGATGAGGAAGAQGTATTSGTMSFVAGGIFVSDVGGANGGAGATNGAAAGSAVTALSFGLLSGGGGGGGVTVTTNVVSNGGAITGVGIIPTLAGGTGNATAPTAGSDGIWLWRPMCGTGGAGGGASGTGGVGGFGGRGAYGCGGGGGGAGVTGGTGGDGGPGLVIISCW